MRIDFKNFFCLQDLTLLCVLKHGTPHLVTSNENLESLMEVGAVSQSIVMWCDSLHVPDSGQDLRFREGFC